MFKTKAEKITETITNYFEGIYSGNVEQLGSSFHQDAFLYGDIKGSEYAKSLKDYLEGVRNRKSPQELQDEKKMEIVSLEIVGDVSIVKVHVPMLGYNYYDFLSLAVVNGEWKIVNKIFTHVD